VTSTVEANPTPAIRQTPRSLATVRECLASALENGASAHGLRLARPVVVPKEALMYDTKVWLTSQQLQLLLYRIFDVDDDSFGFDDDVELPLEPEDIPWNRN
jgi:hypothetical protein